MLNTQLLRKVTGIGIQRAIFTDRLPFGTYLSYRSTTRDAMNILQI